LIKLRRLLVDNPLAQAHNDGGGPKGAGCVIRRFFSRFLDPDRSRFSRVTLTLLAISAWINNFLAFLFWGGVQLNNLGVWAEANLFWFVSCSSSRPSLLVCWVCSGKS
jgi:hypothetical protein